ncbi:MAG: ParB/RepB/Spo0J family partition protein, partial [Gemmatimonadetes bacterium]|nr:ParB/RepB/Spo0J family partition protein [Gemmatimonadota bacterium]
VKVVRQGDGYQIVDGECRYRACLRAGLETIRAVVLDVDEGQRLAIQATANLARQDVRPCEEATAYAKIIEHLRAEKPWLSEEDARKRCAKVTGKPLQRIAFKLKLLALPVEVQELVDKGALGEGQALALGRLAEGDPAEAGRAECVRLARKAVAQALSVADVKARVAAYVGEQAQCSLFGADEGKASVEARKTRDTLGRVVGHLERVADLTFDEKQQALALGELRADELAAARAKLAGAARHLGALLAEVDAARGSEGPVSVGGGSAGPVALAPDPLDDLRTEARGAWLWVLGAPAPNGHPLTRDLYLAGAVWSSRRGAWYAPDEVRAQRVAAVIEDYRQAVLPETQREASA